MSIKIDTNIVRTTAVQIAATNQKISDDFSPLENAISNMNSNWSGTASNAALEKFRNIKSTFYDDRFLVINDMVNFMNKQIGDGYETTETAITSAASAFK